MADITPEPDAYNVNREDGVSPSEEFAPPLASSSGASITGTVDNPVEEQPDRDSLDSPVEAEPDNRNTIDTRDDRPEIPTANPRPSRIRSSNHQKEGSIATAEKDDPSEMLRKSEMNNRPDAVANRADTGDEKADPRGGAAPSASEAAPSESDAAPSASKAAPSASEDEEEEIDQSIVHEVVLDEINRRRAEEKAIFQQLIGDCTQLQGEVERLQSGKVELEAQRDIGHIELETVKEQMAEQGDQTMELRREIAELKKRNRVERSSRTDVNSRTRLDGYGSEGQTEPTDVHNQVEDDSTRASEHWLEVKELRLRLQRMAKDDQRKTDRVCRLEREIQGLNAVVEAVEREFGKEKMESFRQTGEEMGRGQRKKSISKGNIIEPAAQSSVCIIS